MSKTAKTTAENAAKEVAQPTTAELVNSGINYLTEVKTEFETIMSETKVIIQTNIAYAVRMGSLLINVQEHQKKLKKQYNGGLKVTTSDGERKADLTIVKDGNGKLGFWGYLRAEGLIPFGQSQVFKFIRIAQQAEAINSLTPTEQLQFGLNDMNEADKFAKYIKAGGEAAKYLDPVETASAEGETATATAKKEVEKRVSFSELADKREIKISYFQSAHKSTTGAKVALLNLFLKELGITKLMPSTMTSLREQLEQVERGELVLMKPESEAKAETPKPAPAAKPTPKATRKKATK